MEIIHSSGVGSHQSASSFSLTAMQLLLRIIDCARYPFHYSAVEHRKYLKRNKRDPHSPHLTRTARWNNILRGSRAIVKSNVSLEVKIYPGIEWKLRIRGSNFGIFREETVFKLRCFVNFRHLLGTLFCKLQTQLLVFNITRLPDEISAICVY